MTSKAFKAGDLVFVRSLSKTGSIVEALSGGQYRVAIGWMTVKVSAVDLEDKVDAAPDSATPRIPVPRQKRGTVPASIDLHGLTVDEGIRVLEKWLNDAIVAGLSQVKIVHGLGSGRLQQATHATLQRYSAVRAFRINDVNPGVTDVYLG